MGHRGPHPEDPRLFREKALPVLRAAYAEVSWLLGRGYRIESALRVVGEHHQLHARQRLALQRTACSEELCAARRAKALRPQQAGEGPWSIDGFNLIITLEVGLSKGLLLRGGDRSLRDLAGLRGSYHLVEETDTAIELLGTAIRILRPPAIRIWLDSPVANSGRLRARIGERAASWPAPVEIELAQDPDRCLVGKERVISSDSAVLDACASWLNLAAWIFTDLRPEPWPEPWIVDLDPGPRGQSEPPSARAALRDTMHVQPQGGARPMSILDRIKNLIQADHISRWPLDERSALIRLLYSACAADEAYSAREQAWLKETMKDIGTPWEEIDRIELPEAARLLCSDPEKEAQLYRLLAGALFADGDYDQAERSFVSRLCSEQGLSRAKLEEEIKRARGRILDGALADWNRRIESSDGTLPPTREEGGGSES
jgi:uncharacterized tellurite resistance protein B-like protein